jgi:hypothetical protein
MSQVLRSAQPLAPADRSEFLRDVATALQGREIGDGVIGRVCREIQARYRHPLDLSRGNDQSKYR